MRCQPRRLQNFRKRLKTMRNFLPPPCRLIPAFRYAYTMHNRLTKDARFLRGFQLTPCSQLVALNHLINSLFSNTCKKNSLQPACFHTLIKTLVYNLPVFIHLCFAPPHTPPPLPSPSKPPGQPRSPSGNGRGIATFFAVARRIRHGSFRSAPTALLTVFRQGLEHLCIV